jgi:hypothetical protein
MNVLLFGATGMIGQGVLHECLLSPRVKSILAPTRSPIARVHSKLKVLQRTDFRDFSDITRELQVIDACFFCLGVSSVGMTEAKYRELTFDLALAAARALAASNPSAVFCYVSGQGTDSTARGKSMWARVKGETENAILALPLNAFMFRPGFVRPHPGVTSKTRLYRVVYAVFNPLYPALKRLAPAHVTALVVARVTDDELVRHVVPDDGVPLAYDGADVLHDLVVRVLEVQRVDAGAPVAEPERRRIGRQHVGERVEVCVTQAQLVALVQVVIDAREEARRRRLVLIALERAGLVAEVAAQVTAERLEVAAQHARDVAFGRLAALVGAERRTRLGEAVALVSDDTFAFFSNFGRGIELIAPGVCIRSTHLGGMFAFVSETSISAPHVTGGAALYRAEHPAASPATTRAALIRSGRFDWNEEDDPDAETEPLLNVARF